MSSCVMHPTVTNPNTGTSTPSVLYGDLLKYSNNNRQISNDIYTKSLGTEFKEYVNSEGDTNKEPLIEDILYRFNDEEIIPDSIITNTIAKDLGESESKGIYSVVKEHQYSYSTNRNILKKSIKFNDSHRLNKAYVGGINTDGVTSNISFKRHSVSKFDSTQVKRNEMLFSALERILSNAGIGIKVLEELENKYIDGYVDFSTAERTAEGLKAIITLVRGERGIDALPEEFSHVMLEMLGSDNPLVNRLYSYLDKDAIEFILGEDFDKYLDIHNNNYDLLKREAAAKLLANSLKGEFLEEIQPLQERIIRQLNQVTSRLDESSISDALLNILNVVDDLKEELFSDTLYGKLSLDNVEVENILYSVKQQLDPLKEMFDKFFEATVKRDSILKSKHLDPESKILRYSEMLKYYSNEANLEGIIYYMSSITEEAMALNKYIKAGNFNKLSLKAKFKTINSAIQLQKLLSHSLGVFNTIVEDNPNILTPELEQLRRSLIFSVGNMENQTLSIAKALSIEKISEYKEHLGDLTKIPVGRNSMKTMTIKEILDSNPYDITFFEKWTSAAAQTSDPFLRIMDRIIKVHKEKGRLEFIGDLSKIHSLGLRAERDGITDWSFMYVRENGKILPKLLEIRDYKAYTEYMKSIPESERETVKAQVTEELFGQIVPSEKLFPSKELSTLTPIQKKYYLEYIALKQKYDKYLPYNNGLPKRINPIFVRKNKYDRLKEQGILGVGKGIKDDFVRTFEDIDIVDMDNVMLDFTGVPSLSIPLNYVKMGKEDSIEDFVLDDAIGNLTLYAYMAINHAKMFDFIDFIEVSKEIAYHRDIEDDNKIEKFLHRGVEVTNNAYKRKGTSNFLDRYYSLLEQNIYGVGTKKSTIGNLEISKIAGNFAALNGMITMSINGLNVVANVLNGLLQSNLEAAAQEYFKASDLVKADIIYGKNAPEIISDSYSRIKSNKISLANRLFNTIQGHRLDADNREFNKERWIKKFMNAEVLSDGNSAGEHFLHSRTMIAMMLGTKLKDNKGKETNLWEALEEYEVDGIKNITIPLNKEYILEDGTVLDTQDKIDSFITSMSLRINGLNQRMYGIYNKIDSSMAQQFSLGVLALMYRKWVKPSLDRRFKRKYYNYDLQTDVEGIYMTLGRYIKDTVQSLYKGTFSLEMFKEIPKADKYNLIRAGIELLTTIVLFALTRFYYDDEDKPYSERSYHDKFVEYLVRRSLVESLVLVPTPSSLNSWTEMFSNPIPMIGTLTRIADLTSLLLPQNYETFYGEDALIGSGRFKGWSKVEKTLFNSPFTLFAPNIYKAIHIEDQINFYKRSD